MAIAIVLEGLFSLQPTLLEGPIFTFALRREFYLFPRIFLMYRFQDLIFELLLLVLSSYPFLIQLFCRIRKLGKTGHIILILFIPFLIISNYLRLVDRDNQ